MNVREFHKRNPWFIQATIVLVAFDIANYCFRHQWLDASKALASWIILLLSLMLNAVAGRYIKGREYRFPALNLSKLLSITFGGMGLVHLAKGDFIGATLFLALPHAALLYFFLFALWTAESTPSEAESDGFVLNSENQ